LNMLLRMASIESRVELLLVGELLLLRGLLLLLWGLLVLLGGGEGPAVGPAGAAGEGEGPAVASEGGRTAGTVEEPPPCWPRG
jgi:hypothetical protein